MRPIAFFTIIFILLFCSCRDGLDRDMDRAEALIETHPDSAYAILLQTPWNSIKNDRQKARYGLLANQAMNANYIEAPNDSMIDFSLEFYDHSRFSESEELAKTLYYKSLSEEKSQQIPQGMAHAMRSRDISSALNLPEWESRAWSVLTLLYGDSFDYYHGIKAGEEAAKKFKEAGLDYHYQFALIDRAMLYTAYGKSKEAIYLLDSLWHTQKPYNDIVRDYSFMAYASAYSHNDQGEKALQYLDSINEDSHYHIYDSEHITFLASSLEALLKTGQLEEADSVIRILDEHYNGKHLDLMKMKYTYFKAIGEPDSALAYLEKHTDIMYDMIRESMANSALSAGTQYYQDQYKAKAAEQAEIRRNTIRLAIAALIVLALIALVVWYRMREQKRELDRRMTDISAMSEDSEQMRRRMEELEDRVSGDEKTRRELSDMIGLYTAQFSSLDKLINNYGYNSSLPERSRVKDMNVLLSEIFSPRYFETLEDGLNRVYGNIIREMRAACPFVSGDQIHIFDLVIVGFGSKAICTIFHISYPKFNTDKARQRKRILESGWSRAAEYCALLDSRRPRPEKPE